MYGDNLVYFLREDAALARFNSKIHVLNPKSVNKEFTNDCLRTDLIDSFVIADCLRFGRINKEVYIGDYRYKALQNLLHEHVISLFQPHQRKATFYEHTLRSILL